MEKGDSIWPIFWANSYSLLNCKDESKIYMELLKPSHPVQLDSYPDSIIGDDPADSIPVYASQEVPKGKGHIKHLSKKKKNKLF